MGDYFLSANEKKSGKKKNVTLPYYATLRNRKQT